MLGMNIAYTADYTAAIQACSRVPPCGFCHGIWCTAAGLQQLKRGAKAHAQHIFHLSVLLPAALQAVQLLPEHRVHPGQCLALTASHDTYAISFSIAGTAAQPQPSASGRQQTSCAVNASNAATAADNSIMQPTQVTPAAAVPGTPQPTGVPFVDPAWKAAYDAVSALQASLAKAAAQDPLEYRRLATAALLLAMRPWGSVEAAAAASSGAKAAAAGAAAAGKGEQQGGEPEVEESGSSSTRSAAASAKAQSRSVAAAAAVSGVLARQPAADPHHAAALLVRFMS